MRPIPHLSLPFAALLCFLTLGCDMDPPDGPPVHLGAPPPIGTLPQDNCDAVLLNDIEQEVFKAINHERWRQNIPEINLSVSLTTVAQLHADDAAANPNRFDQTCDLHSWSTSTDWSGCCYTSNDTDASCMWNKPAEIMGFQATGYELAYRGYGSVQAILNDWLASPSHADVLLNQNEWSVMPFQSIGVGAAQSDDDELFVYVWFAVEGECLD